MGITELVVTVIVAVLSSGGFWAFLQKRAEKKDSRTKLLLGLAHNHIVLNGLAFIERGWITHEEYDDFVHYLYEPYSEFGGNGLANKVAEEVRRLPLVRNGDRKDISNDDQ